jgi:hypothetical protein
VAVLATLAGPLVVAPAAAAADVVTLVASDFEDGSAQGWGPRGPVTVAASTEHAGQA